MSVPNYINILASDCFMDASGALMAKGTLTINAVDGTGQSVPFHVGGGGIALVHTITRPIAIGSMTGSLQLANPAAADISVGYTFVISDAATFDTTTFNAVALTADENGDFDLSALNAGSYAVAQPVAYVSGSPGVAATVTVGTTTTLAAGDDATVTNVGTTNAAVLNFGIPQGESGTGGSGSSAWGGITGTLSAQTDLEAALAAKAAASSLATVATSGSYADLTNKPSIPAAQVNSDWNAGSGLAQILNKPALATVATSGSYSDLSNKPTLGTAAAQPTTAFDAAGTAAAVAANLTTETTRAEAAEALLVPKTTTVNGHALSANVVVSASDLTTGTLPHAQLPALVSGDIPANAANTTGSAATLTTARTINGTSFNGSANITITAAAATLTGTALPVAVIVPAAQVSGLATLATSGLTLTTTGSSGASTLTGTTLNIPQYAGGGSMVYPGAGVPVSTGSAWTTSLTAPTSALVGTSDTQTLTNKSIVATQLTGTVAAAQFPALTGDVTSSSGSVATTVAKINGTSLAGLATGILKNTTTTGVPSIAVAADFPTLNQNTTGSAAKLTTARTINGTSFDGTGNITVTAATATLTGTALPVAVIVPATQISGLATSATNDTTNASNIITGTLASAQLPSNVRLDSICFTVDGGGVAPSTGSKGFTMVPYACTINSVTLVADVSGSAVIDIKKSSYSGFPTTTSITASDKPTLSATQKNQDATLTGWTTTVSAGDVLEFVLNSASTLTRVNLILSVTRT